MKKPKAATNSGPLFRIFSNPTARILDEVKNMGKTEQTISALSKATGLDYKTVKTVLLHLIKLDLVRKTRKVGNAQVFQFEVENKLSQLLSWAVSIENPAAQNTRQPNTGAD